MKRIGYGIVIILVLFVLSACSSSQSTKKTTKESQTPTVFFHGYGGGPSSFGSMMQRLKDKGEAKKELTLTVQEDGTISAEGKLSDDKGNPMIQVIFQSNKSTQTNQSLWIAAVLHYLNVTYQIDKVNLVGHSMGAVRTIDYLEQHAKEDQQPNVAKVVLIAGPFNGFLDTFSSQSQTDLLANGPSEQSARYQQFLVDASRLDRSLVVEVISGQLSDTDLSDGIVPLASSLAIVPLLKNQGISVTSKIVKGSKAQRSQLHENQTVDNLLIHFLWQ